MELVNLFNLKGVKFDWCLATEHGDHDAELTFAGVDLSNGTFEAFEWSIGNGDNFVKCVVDGIFWILYAIRFLILLISFSETGVG